MNFRFLNIPVSIQPTFWVFLLIFCFIPGIEIWQMSLLGLVLFFSLLFHEYGHALAAVKYGRAPKITIEGFGGYASYDGRGLSDKQHFFITLAGPLFTALLIGLSYYVLKNQLFDAIALRYFFFYMMRLNIYWLIINLCPLEPLDGGKLASYLLKKWLGENRGRKWSLMLGNVVGAAGGGYFLINGHYFFAFILLFHGWKNFQVYSAEYTKKKPSPLMLYNEASSLFDRGEKEKAKAALVKLMKSKDDYIRVHSIKLLARLSADEGLEKEAFILLKKAGIEKLGRGKCLLLKLAYTQGKFDLFNQFAREAYDLEPTFEIAILNAKAFAQLKNTSYAVGWLNTASKFKEAKGQLFLEDPVFIPIKDHPEFIQVVEEVGVDSASS